MNEINLSNFIMLVQMLMLNFLSTRRVVLCNKSMLYITFLYKGRLGSQMEGVEEKRAIIDSRSKGSKRSPK